MNRPLFAAVLCLSLAAFAKPATKKVPYELDKVAFEGVLVFDDAAGPKPGVLMVPNWLGLSAANLKQAELVASRGYTVFVADVWGAKSQPKTMEEAGKAAGALKENRALLRKRVVKAFEAFQALKHAAVDATKWGAIGFCFGGTTALELARSGAPLSGVVTFHAGLGSPTPDDAKNIKAKVLALHGADDPFVPAEEVTAFQSEMRAAKVDWALVAYGNAVHSFTDVDAKMPGKSDYNPAVAARAYTAMDSLFAEAFSKR